MENLDKLLIQKRYKEIIELTKDSKDIDELFIRVAAFTFLEEYDNAQGCLEDNRAIFKEQLPRLMEMDILISYRQNDFDAAYKKLERYEDEPYFSQEMEEKLRFYRADIRTREKKYYASFRNNDASINDKLVKDFHSEDPLINLGALNYINLHKSEFEDKEVNKDWIDGVKYMTEHSKSQQARTMALFFLMEVNYSEPIKFLSHDGLIEVLPNKCEKPFSSRQFKDLLKKSKEEKDVTFSKFFEAVLARLSAYMYLSEFFEDDINVYHAIRYEVLKSLKQFDGTLDDYIAIYNCHEKAVKRIYDLIVKSDDLK